MHKRILVCFFMPHSVYSNVQWILSYGKQTLRAGISLPWYACNFTHSRFSLQTQNVCLGSNFIGSPCCGFIVDPLNILEMPCLLVMHERPITAWQVLTKDSVTVSVDAVVYYRVSNATVSVANVENAHHSTRLLAQTTLRNVLGTKNLSEILSEREAISNMMQVRPLRRKI